MDQSDVVTRPEIGRHRFLHDPEAFDKEIRCFVPCQAEILDSLLESMLLMESDYSPILELGCRTGLLSSRLLEEKPYVKLTAVDQDPAMLLACKERLGRAAGWVETERRNIPRYSRQGAFDHILSNLALNFLESPEDKESVCRNAFWSLKPGGIFAFSVMLDVGSSEAGSMLWKQWERDVMGMGAQRQDIQEWHLNNRPAYATVPQQTWLEWLREAGFIHGELVWCETIFGTFWAKKPADGGARRPSGPS
ncbi:MAG: class I SAM-dependent methyltransferase [Candidatus Aminicenantales bacterium]